LLQTTVSASTLNSPIFNRGFPICDVNEKKVAASLPAFASTNRLLVFISSPSKPSTNSKHDKNKSKKKQLFPVNHNSDFFDTKTLLEILIGKYIDDHDGTNSASIKKVLYWHLTNILNIENIESILQCAEDLLQFQSNITRTKADTSKLMDLTDLFESARAMVVCFGLIIHNQNSLENNKNDVSTNNCNNNINNRKKFSTNNDAERVVVGVERTERTGRSDEASWYFQGTKNECYGLGLERKYHNIESNNLIVNKNGNKDISFLNKPSNIKIPSRNISFNLNEQKQEFFRQQHKQY
jgi:hypothetical protein